MRQRYATKFLFVVLFLAVSSSTSFAWEPWKFIVTADCRSDSDSDHNGVNIAILTEMVNEVLKHQPDFFLFAGDLCVGTSDPQVLEKQFMTWRGTIQPVYDASIGVYPVRGNHDAVSYPSCITVWNNVFSGPYLLPDNGPAGEVNLTYSVTHKNTLILALDQLQTEFRSKNYVNQAWIDAQLAENTNPHIFAFGHFTAYKMMWDSLGDHPYERDLFWDSLENNCGRTYFCGHEHFFDRASADDDGDPNNDLYQYVIGSAGASEHIWNGTWIGDNSDMTLTSIYHTVLFGYVIVEIDGLNVTLTWMERQNNDPEVPGVYQPADVFSYTLCGDAAHPYPLGDINKDCQVDYTDFAILGNQWGQSPGVPSADIAPEGVGDGEVNLLDLAVLVDHWLEGVPVSLPLPGRATNPVPPNNATGVFPSADLSWTAGSGATSHDVYFGTDIAPPFVTNQTSTTFTPGTMTGYTKHYWRIDERNAWGKTTGTLWTFTTTTEPPP